MPPKTKNKSLRQHALEIKRQFFPRWDRDNRWRFSTGRTRTGEGFCDPEKRVVSIFRQHTDPDDRDTLLIHEICHAVRSCGHGKVWQGRMERAATRADKLGRARLAELLREEIAQYRKATFGADEAYQTIGDWVEAEPSLTWAQVKVLLANLNGLLVSEITTKLRHAEKVFRDAKREAKRIEAAQARFRTRRTTKETP